MRITIHDALQNSKDPEAGVIDILITIIEVNDNEGWITYYIGEEEPPHPYVVFRKNDPRWYELLRGFCKATQEIGQRFAKEAVFLAEQLGTQSATEERLERIVAEDFPAASWIKD